MALQALKGLKDVILKDFPAVLQILQNAAIAAILYGFEYMGQRISPCPCDPEWNATYALLAFVVPAVIFFMISLVVFPDSRRALKCGPRCIPRRDETGSYYETFSTWSKCCFVIVTFLKIVVPSIIWIIILLLDGDYYTCYKDQGTDSHICKHFCSLKNSTDLRHHCLRSRMIGVVLLLMTVILLVFLYFLPAWKCCDCTLERYYEQQYWKIVEHVKLTKLRTELEEKATEFAEVEVKEFICKLNLGNVEPKKQQSNSSADNKDDAANLESTQVKAPFKQPLLRMTSV
ncbi:calcium homeostasis modulator protein 6-like [Mobula birostris]|uniref:calcium homeostasis modulator protein 6-like n=1 Tax=Mobula birostris TaxID=1983395 RepID=UPI003B27DF4A